MLWLIIAIPILFVLGDLIEGGNLEAAPWWGKKPPAWWSNMWPIIGRFMKRVAMAIFVALIIFSIVSGLIVEIRR